MQAKSLVTVAALSAIAVAGRMIFVFIPFFKPVGAIVILSGISLGPAKGAMVGALTMLVSNFYFGQGPWTPLQMIAFSFLGFLAGIFFHKKPERITKPKIIVFAILTQVVLVGPLLDVGFSLFAIRSFEDLPLLVPFLLAGLPVNAIAGVASAIFLAFLTKPFLEKLDRLRVKYGI